MRMYDIILKKRNNLPLSKEETAFFINEYTKGNIPDYQAAALLMAVYFNGMDEHETADLTECMANSGQMIDLSRFKNLSVDKHSTGGVGDKTSLIVAPIVAACGCKLAKMSGRGLGHTGGTIDKLESIPGFRTDLSAREFLTQTENIGIAIISQTANLAPADKMLYALRDVTATVDSIPLITSSVMSKKIAAGAHCIVLDVKFGSGAFMKTPKQAEILANQMVKIGSMCGRKTAALITNMDVPLGKTVGNALEVKEAVEVLKGSGEDQLTEICLTLSANMVSLCFSIDYAEALKRVKSVLNSGGAFKKMKEWIAAQGGDVNYIENPSYLKTSPYILDVLSESEGYISYMNTEQIGLVSVMLGAGRNVKGAAIDYGAGLEIFKKSGEYVNIGQPVCRLYTSDKQCLEAAAEKYRAAIRYSDSKPDLPPHIYKTIRG